jgi:hypothetical protein
MAETIFKFGGWYVVYELVSSAFLAMAAWGLGFFGI